MIASVFWIFIQAIVSPERAPYYAADGMGNVSGNGARSVHMLDEIGLHDALGINSTAPLFGEHQDLAHTSSVCNLTVLQRGVT